jgi:hypothetical protein
MPRGTTAAPDLMAALRNSFEIRFQVRFTRLDGSAAVLRFTSPESAAALQSKLGARDISSELYEKVGGDWLRRDKTGPNQNDIDSAVTL